jgi:hypothetical protein
VLPLQDSQAAVEFHPEARQHLLQHVQVLFFRNPGSEIQREEAPSPYCNEEDLLPMPAFSVISGVYQAIDRNIFLSL